MRKIYERPILEEENIQIEDIVAVSVDINEPVGGLTPSVPRWGNR